MKFSKHPSSRKQQSIRIRAVGSIKSGGVTRKRIRRIGDITEMFKVIIKADKEYNEALRQTAKIYQSDKADKGVT